MAKRFASDTEVPVAKTRAEIEALLTRYMATSFASFIRPTEAMIAFEMRDRKIMFRLPMPDPGAEEFTHFKRGYNQYRRTDTAASAAWEQACRSRWRALLLSIKAKLEAVEVGISLFEDEFLANIMMAGGQTVGELVRPRIEQAYREGRDIPLLPGPSSVQ